MLLASQWESQSGQRYNSLQSVEDAGSKLSRVGTFQHFLTEFAEIAAVHGLCGAVGAFLLHRHFLLRHANEIVHESLFEDEDAGVELRAGRTDRRNVSASVPVRWSFDPERRAFDALEYSDDEGASRRSDELRSDEAFLDAYGRLLVKYELIGLVGVAVAERSSLPVDPEHQYLESTNESYSVTRLVRRSHQYDSWQGTLWVPEVDARCEPGWRCQSRCVPDPFGHGQPHRHEHGRQFQHQHRPF